MGQQPLAETTGNAASITAWTRLEPLPRDSEMQRSLQAQFRDPLWLLARQYQMAEFLGDDAGSPVDATIQVEFRTVTTYRPGDDDAKTTAIDPKPLDPTRPTPPVEVHVEREPVTFFLRGAVQLGLYFERLVYQSASQGTVTDPGGVINAFRTTFQVKGRPPDPVYPAPLDAQRFASLVAGRVVDGETLYRSIVATDNGQVASPPLPAAAGAPGMPAVLKAFKLHRQSLFSEPLADSAWQPTQLSYDFALGSPTKDQNLLLAANGFPGGRVDWYSFSTADAAMSPVASKYPADVQTKQFDLLPNHVVFRGMPDPRWWNFEDSVTDFGQLDADHVDLAKLLVMEFALVYGNDWFSIPVPVTIGASTDPDKPQGTLTRVTALVVTDTFGVRTLIRSAEQTSVDPSKTPWSVYKLSGAETRSDFILLAPTLGLVQDAEPLEQVVFLRDDMAAMAWGIENRLQSDLDVAMDAYEDYLDGIQGQSDPVPAFTPGGPEIYYTIEKTPPLNWIPLVPVRSKQGAPFLRRGALEVPDPSSATGFNLVTAHSIILNPNPGKAFFVVDHAVPRAGLQVKRYFRRTRSSDGTTFLWLARQSAVGRGPGWSGLRFDMVRDIPKKQTS